MMLLPNRFFLITHKASFQDIFLISSESACLSKSTSLTYFSSNSVLRRNLIQILFSVPGDSLHNIYWTAPNEWVSPRAWIFGCSISIWVCICKCDPPSHRTVFVPESCCVVKDILWKIFGFIVLRSCHICDFGSNHGSMLHSECLSYSHRFSKYCRRPFLLAHPVHICLKIKW